MLRPPRLLISACVAGLLGLAVAPWGCTPAFGDETDGTITVKVDLDVNASGEYEAGVDRPQAGIKITVTDVSGRFVHGTTDDDGEYVVRPTTDLTGGRYFVVADIPEGSDLEPVPASDTFQALSTTVDVTSEDQTVRFGVVAPPSPTESPSPDVPPSAPPSDEVPQPSPPPASSRAAQTFAVGDRVWVDSNRQGTQDDGESGAGPTSVQLLSAHGNVLKTTVTRDGHYVFDGLAAGVYSVRFSGIASGFRLSPTGTGGAAEDSDPDYTGLTPSFTLAMGAANVRAATADDHVEAAYINSTVDAGLAPVRYAIASSVWTDTSGDGVQQVGEPPGQARVTLLDAATDAPIRTGATDAAGRFRFEDLPAGRYRLHFDDLGAHRKLTAAHVGSNRAVDSEPDPRTRTTPAFALNQTSSDLVPARDFGPVDADFVDATVNAGVVGSYTIKNRVWNDENGDGLFSVGEAGIGGIEVQVLDAAGAVVATTITDSEGWYSFTSLPAGRYRLKFLRVPKGLHFTAPAMGGDRNRDSDVYANALTAPISVGDDHPEENAISAGLTSSATAATTDAPSGSPVVAATATAPASLGGTGGVPAFVPAAGTTLLLLGGAVLWFVHRRRRSRT